MATRLNVSSEVETVLSSFAVRTIVFIDSSVKPSFCIGQYLIFFHLIVKILNSYRLSWYIEQLMHVLCVHVHVYCTYSKSL